MLKACLSIQIIQNLSIVFDFNVNCSFLHLDSQFQVLFGESPTANKIILIMNCVLDEMLICSISIILVLNPFIVLCKETSFTLLSVPSISAADCL